MSADAIRTEFELAVLTVVRRFLNVAGGFPRSGRCALRCRDSDTAFTLIAAPGLSAPGDM